MGYRPQSDDTSPAAERIQFEVYRRMSPAEKLEAVKTLSRQANALALAGLRLRFPKASEAELRQRLLELRLGPELAARVRPRQDA